MRNGSLLWGAVAVLLIALLAVMQFRYDSAELHEGVTRLTTLPCDLAREQCSASLGGEFALSVSITPQPIAVLTPLQVEITYRGQTVTSAIIEFTGVDMAMGVNRFPLQPASGEGRLLGKAMLPVCVEDEMPWRAQLRLETTTGPLLATFNFRSIKP